MQPASGIVSFVYIATGDIGAMVPVWILLPITCATNGVVVILISARLLYAHRLLSQLQSRSGINNSRNNGNSRSPYLTALAICVESSAIILVTAILCMIPQLRLLPTLILPQICVSNYYFLFVRVCVLTSPFLECVLTGNRAASHYL